MNLLNSWTNAICIGSILFVFFRAKLLLESEVNLETVPSRGLDIQFLNY